MADLEERFELGKLIGAGGIGIVHEATDRVLERKVAIKILNQESSGDEERIQRFLREMKVAAKLASPHAVKVLEVGRRGDGGDPYMVMELLEGDSLVAIASRGPVPVEKAVAWIAQACDALEEAHAKGFVHRDAKLDNIFLAKTPTGGEIVKVLDFGLARGLRRAGSEATLTPADQVLGSPRYMSPEQLVAARDVDPRTDIWALGVCLYRLISGRFPFPGDTFGELCVQVMSKPVPELDAPKRVRRVIMKCLSREVAKRYANAGELRVALTRALEPEPFLEEASPSSATPPSGVHAVAATMLVAKPARDLSRYAIWLVVPIVVTMAVIVMLLTRPVERTSASPASPASPASTGAASTAPASMTGPMAGQPSPSGSTSAGSPAEDPAASGSAEPSPTSSHKRRGPRKPGNGLFNTER